MCSSDLAYRAGVHPAGLDYLTCDDELGQCFEIRASRMDKYLVCSEALVHVAFSLDADVLQESAGDAAEILTDIPSTGQGETDLATDFAELLVNVDDFLHSLIIKVELFAEPLFGFFCGVCCIFLENIQIGDKIPIFGIVEFLVRSTGEVLFAGGEEIGRASCRERV